MTTAAAFAQAVSYQLGKTLPRLPTRPDDADASMLSRMIARCLFQASPEPWEAIIERVFPSLPEADRCRFRRLFRRLH